MILCNKIIRADNIRPYIPRLYSAINCNLKTSIFPLNSCRFYAMIILNYYAPSRLQGGTNMLDDILGTYAQSMQKTRDDPAYQAGCLRFSQELDRLEEIFSKLSQQKAALKSYCDANTVRREYASGSDLHRGFYCPSPTFDIIVGKTKRGRLLKRLTSASKPTHEYGFDANGKLLYCKGLLGGQSAAVEYLIYEGQRVYGITFEEDAFPRYLTEETFRDGKLTDYAHCLFLLLDNGYSSREITLEHYEYDDEGLCLCSMDRYCQSSPLPIPEGLYQHMGSYRFRRENGLLVSYTNEKGHEYQVYTQRKA